MKLRLLGYFDKNFGNDVMTRAEFCQLFNNIIGRNDMGLTALDQNGNEYEVTPAVLPVLVTVTRTVTVVSSAVYAASAKEKVVYGLSFRQNDLRKKDQTQHPDGAAITEYLQHNYMTDISASLPPNDALYFH